MEQTQKIQAGIASYLDQFDRSPYSYPANDRKSVVGKSTLKGSWQPSPKN
ncbi:hypothetical protein [Rhizobium leguminosarum]